jgi:hypothetical protein
MSNVNASEIAAHNDGVLAWLTYLTTLTTDDGIAKRHPALSSAFESFLRIASGLVAQTGFLSSGTNSGATKGEYEINKPYDVIPFNQSKANVVTVVGNVRHADQDATIATAIIAGLVVTTDSKSTHDWRGQEKQGAGHHRKARKDGSITYPKLSISKSKRFSAMLAEAGIERISKKGEPVRYFMSEASKASLRKSGCPVFPAGALSLPLPSGRPSRVFNASLTIKVGKETKVLPLQSGKPETFLLLSKVLKGGSSLSTTVEVSDPATVDSWRERYADAGLTLIVKEGKSSTAKGADVAPVEEAQDANPPMAEAVNQ